MSVDSELTAALKAIAPVEADVYEGKREIYITFNYDTIPADFGDDEAWHERVLAQVHLYAPTGRNVLRERQAIKRALHRAGFTWPECVNASDKDGQHHVFVCETAREAGDG